MGSQGTRLTFDVLRSIDSSTFTGSYQAVGSRLSFPARIFKFFNNSTSFVTVSFDGSNAADVVPAGGFCLYDAGTNKGEANTFELPAYSQVYVEGSAGTGLFYVTVIYATGG